MFNLCDKKGNVIKTFPSKNQAEKFKKKLRDSGYVGILMIVEEKNDERIRSIKKNR